MSLYVYNIHLWKHIQWWHLTELSVAFFFPSLSLALFSTKKLVTSIKNNDLVCIKKNKELYLAHHFFFFNCTIKKKASSNCYWCKLTNNSYLKGILIPRVVEHCNSLPWKVVTSPAWWLKKHFENVLSTWS